MRGRRKRWERWEIWYLIPVGLQSRKPLLILTWYLVLSIDKNERTVIMDKSKGEPVISVKTKSKERVSNSSPFNENETSFRPVCQLGLFTSSSSVDFCFLNIGLTLFFRAQRVATTNHPVKRGKTSCHLIRSRSRGRGSGRDNESGR